MDKDKDILKDFFKGKLQDYAPPVKRDIWSSLESQIPAEKSLWRRIYPVIASAAAVLLIFILSYKYVFNESPDSSKTIVSVIENNAQSLSTDEGRESELTENVDLESVSENEIKLEPPVADVVVKSNTEPNLVYEEKQEFAEASTGIAQNFTEAESGTTNDSPAKEKSENPANPPLNDIRKDEFGNHNHYVQLKKKDNINSKMQISLSGKGFPAMSNDLDYLKIYNTAYLSSYENKFQIDELFKGSEPTGHNPFPPSWFPADNYRLMNIKYHTPVTLSMYVSKKISSRWAIETGISYTKLSSEEIWEGEVEWSYETDILTSNVELYYLGIPLRASYYPIKKNRFFVYVSAGGMIEKCISGKAFTVAEKAKKEESTNLKISELQYSVTGGVGIGLQIFKPVSLFVEPGFIYYFDDGSDIMTVRNDKPFNFNIQGGLKFHF